MSSLNKEDLCRLTMELEINSENDPRLHAYTYVRCSSRKRGLSYGGTRPLTSCRLSHDIFVMEGMPIPSMHVAVSEAEEIKWVCDQITRENLSSVGIAVIAKKQQHAKLRRILEKDCIPIIVYLLVIKSMRGSFYLMSLKDYLPI